MALHKMHLGLDRNSGMVFCGGSVYCGTLRQSGRGGNRRIQSIKGVQQVTRLQVFSHIVLKYLLVIPCLIAVMMGMLFDGGLQYARISAKEDAAFVIRLQINPASVSLMQLNNERI
jgi:hypothetical protein